MNVFAHFPKGIRNALVAVILPLAVTCAFAVKTRILKGGLYSSELSFRYQTNAFFNGSFALRTTPLGHLHDWAWYDGAEQAWGLGIPFLRFPFEILASFVHSEFPDRLVFLMIYFGTAVAVLTARWGVSELFWRAATLFLLMFNPSLLQLVGGSHFWVYEETIACSVLWSLLTFSLLLHALGSRKPWIWVLFGTVAGYAIMIRPTGLYFGVACAAVFAWLRRRHAAERAYLAALAAFAAGPALALATNELRYGTPFSFGHFLQLVYNGREFFARHWDYPYRAEPLRSAARELLDALWTSDVKKRYYSSTYRWRENYLDLDYGRLLYVPGASLLVPPAMWLLVRRFRKRGWTFRCRHAVNAAVAICAVGAPLFFFFFMRNLALTPRYLAEFIPFIYLGANALLIFMAELCRHLGRRRISDLAALAAAVALASWGFAFTPYGKESPENWTLEGVRKELKPWMGLQPRLPEEYTCGMPGRDRGIPYNGKGWSDKCRVEEATVLFFDNPECLEVTYVGAPHGVAVDVGFDHWRETWMVRRDGGQITQRFCAPAKPDPSFVYSPAKLVVIGWSVVDKLGESHPPLIVLRSVKKVPSSL